MAELDRLRKDVYTLPPGEPVYVSELPSDFVQTMLGTPRWIAEPGSTAQYRGPEAMHAYKVGDEFKVHRDRYDPKENPVGHFLLDAPELAIAAASAAAAGILAYFSLERWDRDKTEEDGKERPAWIRYAFAFAIALAVFVGIYILGAIVRVGMHLA